MESARLEELLRSKMDALPTKARRVVEYLLANTREAAFLSIGDVAEKLDVSKAQLVRVSRVLGFSGYSDLKGALKDAVLEQVNPSATLSRSITSFSNLPVEIHRLEHANLDDTWNQLRAESIGEFCSILRKSGTIYCVGWGISSLVAEFLYTRLLEMGLKGVLIKRGSMALIEQARAFTAEDSVVVCELPSYVIEVTESMKRASEIGATVVTLTDSPAAPVCKFANLSFYVSDASPTFGSSLIGPFFLIHVLTSALAANLGDKAKDALKDQEKGLHDERIYYPTFGLRY